MRGASDDGCPYRKGRFGHRLKCALGEHHMKRKAGAGNAATSPGAPRTGATGSWRGPGMGAEPPERISPADTLLSDFWVPEHRRVIFCGLSCPGSGALSR